MHDPANGLLRIHLPRTPVNKRLIEQGIPSKASEDSSPIHCHVFPFLA
jgi:hypothetical protein